MRERKNVRIDELIVWSDNPRNGYIPDSLNMSENDVINLLIDIVGEMKMYKLAKDIFDSKGLNGNVIPTVVEKNGKYLVYDGNRRISSMKMLINPEIIESENLRKKIVLLTKKADISFLNDVFVYETNEEEALKLMDKTHSGEQEGVGVIPWDSFNKDVSLVKRGQQARYPYAYAVTSLLGWKKKMDFDIPYTDLQRLFSSKALLDSFEVKRIDEKNKRKVEQAIDALLLFKKRTKFASFSRYFNITDSSVDSDSIKPINAFISWWGEQKKSQSTYIVKIDKTEFFTDSSYILDYSTIHIFERKNQEKEVLFEKEEVSVSYINPSGKEQKELENSIGGKWSIVVLYKGVTGIGEIFVKTPRSNPEVSFVEEMKTIRKGDSLNLKNLIKYSKSIHDNEMVLKEVASVGEKRASIDNFVFSSSNDVGTYSISFKFDNDGTEYSKVVDIEVLSDRTKLATKAKEVPFEFIGNSKISFSNGVIEIMNEVNELWEKGRFKYVIACSIRAVAEMSLDAIFVKNCKIFDINDKLEEKITKLADHLLTNKTTLTDMSKNMSVSYKNLKNQIQILKEKAEVISSTLNIGAHKSGAGLDSKDLFEKTHAYITLIVQIAEWIKLRI